MEEKNIIKIRLADIADAPPRRLKRGRVDEDAAALAEHAAIEARPDGDLEALQLGEEARESGRKGAGQPYWAFRWKQPAGNKATTVIADFSGRELPEDEKLRLAFESATRFNERLSTARQRVREDLARADALKVAQRTPLEAANATFPSHSVPFLVGDGGNSVFYSSNNALSASRTTLESFITMNVNNEHTKLFSETTPRLGMYFARRFQRRRRRKMADYAQPMHAALDK